MTVGEYAAIAAALVSVISLILSRKDKRIDDIKVSISEFKLEMKKEITEGRSDVKLEISNINERLRILGDKIEIRFDRLDDRFLDLSERMAFVEAESIYANFSPHEQPSTPKAITTQVRRRRRKNV